MAKRERYSAWINGAGRDIFFFTRCDECIVTVFVWSSTLPFPINAMTDAVRKHEQDWHSELSEA